MDQRFGFYVCRALGRRFRSSHSFELSAVLFKANDPAGRLLSWRGFALHDRQTTLNERVAFVPNRAFESGPCVQANEVEPFSEVDGRFGYYLRGHWDYRKRSELRVYYYDNNGDPATFNPVPASMAGIPGLCRSPGSTGSPAPTEPQPVDGESAVSVLVIHGDWV